RWAVLGVGLAWSAGVLFLLSRWLVGGLVLGRLRRTAATATGPAADLFDRCRTEMGLRRFGLATHPRVRSPFLCGWLRPLILVPPDWAELPEPARRAALLHELAHAARGDHFLTPFLRIVSIAFFFHPLVRWLLARLEREREILCDEGTVARGIDP